MQGWTFGIPTDGIHSIQYHKQIIDSIFQQNIPGFEILFITENRNYQLNDISDSRVQLIYMDSNKNHHITKKKNMLVQQAKYENICLIHSYIYLDKDWYAEVNKYGYNWSVGCCKTLNVDGKRSNDWLTCGLPGAPSEFMALDYDHPATPYHYAPGNSFCVKKSFALQHPFDEQLCWGGGEDITWCRSFDIVTHMKLLGDAKFHILKMKNTFEKTEKYKDTIYWEQTHVSYIPHSGPS